VLNRSLSTQAAKELARRFGGDPSSADWRHFGRLAGFTNQKPHRRLINGLAPFVWLHESSGRTYDKTEEFLAEATARLRQVVSERKLQRQNSPITLLGSIRPLSLFHRDHRYGGDLHRADLAWALHAANRGLSHQEILSQILHVRDLSKKGRRGRQLAYAHRTAAKAVALAHPIKL
jgi:RepB DNA-primase from phage plasmid